MGTTLDRLAERIPILFLIVGASLALAYTLIVPPFQVPDEDRHLWRAYSVSELHLLAPPRTAVPASFTALHDRFSPGFEAVPQKRVVSTSELVRWLRQPLESKVTVAIENPRANLYSFVPYLATSLVLAIGRIAHCSPLLLLYTGRMANAAVYLWLVYMALRLLPEFRLLLLTIALSPMSLHLAASYSADSLTLALTAFLTAYILRLALNSAVTKISLHEMTVMSMLLILLALCKFNVWTLLLLLWIPAWKFGSRQRVATFGAICISSVFGASLLWHRFNRPAILAFRVMAVGEGKSPVENLAFVLYHPLRFFELMLLTDWHFAWIYWKEFVGVFGWNFLQLSPLHVLLYTAAILLAACTQSARIEITRWQKIVGASFAVLTFVSVQVLLWTFETPLHLIQHAFDQTVYVRGVQGRYFLPVALPALMIAKCRFQLNGLLLAGVLSLVVGVNIFALMTISLAYS